ncbi:MAG TPA: hypothetical protein VGN63_14625 [Flavisolibacter sp.]|jgi:hypothetical protein|nr:hypothetical protein [Flavisolibacter sp.]
MNEQQTALCLAFEALERDRQMDALQREGVYIGKLKSGEEVKLLYQYQSIYVEVIYAVYRTHITAVHCFTDTRILDLYLSSTDFDTHGIG